MYTTAEHRLVSAAQMRDIDTETISRWKIPGAILMNNAGKILADYILQEGWHSVAVVCGTGNNGGDGFAAAMYLNAAGIDVQVYFDTAKEERLSPESASFYSICSMLGLISPYDADFSFHDCIIDSLLGIGIEGEVRGPVAALITRINASAAWVVSADIPSGLPASGPVLEGGHVVQAQTTVTMGLKKINLCIYPGADYAGKVIQADAGFPAQLLCTPDPGENVSLFDETTCAAWCDRYADQTIHKYRAGSTLLVGGFHGYEGALALTSRALLCAGTGMAYALSDSINAGRQLPDELIVRQLSGSEYVPLLREYLERSDICVLGSGMGRSEFARCICESVFSLLDECDVRYCLVDGDGLFYLKEMKCKPQKTTLLITPHAGEASYLLDMSSHDIWSDRLAASRELSARYNAVSLLKGPRSIVTQGSRTIVVSAGNSLLATAGSGDVLCGIAASALGRFTDPLDALSTAAHLHGCAADIFREHNPCSFRAGDIIEMFRPALSAISGRISPWTMSTEYP